ATGRPRAGERIGRPTPGGVRATLRRAVHEDREEQAEDHPRDDQGRPAARRRALVQDADFHGDPGECPEAVPAAPEVVGGHPSMEGATPLVEMRAISKAFGAIQALKAVDLSVAPGEVLGLVGDNSAGKSTLMKILTGAYRPDEGEIRILGRRVDID